MSKDTLIDEARALEQKVNDAFCELKKFKEQHPDTRNGFYTNQPGSWLNAYREGDLAFMDAIALIETYARQIAADAVRERDEMLGDTLRRFLEEHCYTLSEDPLLYQFAAELSALKQEAQTDER